MSDVSQELRCCAACREALARDGINHRACIMVLFAMVYDGMSYIEALEAWARYEFDGGWDPERWHNEICRELIRAWQIEPPGLYFDRKAEEVCSNG